MKKLLKPFRMLAAFISKKLSNQNTVIKLLLIFSFAGGIFFILFFKWEIFGGGACGSSATLLYINHVGQRQLKKAAERIDAIISQKKKY